MSDTPQTDAQQLVHSVTGATLHCVDVEFARNLERERDDARAAVLWAVEWLDTLTGRFPEDGSVDEMFNELAKDRLTNKALDVTWDLVGWTQAVAKEVRG
jgi:hypothetical protein